MSQKLDISLKELVLDLSNFRTIRQKDELSAIHAMIAINPDWFWALSESLIEDGYLPTENIIILKHKDKYVVKEGNRRIAALKLIQGHIALADNIIPENILTLIKTVSDKWKLDNEIVPCTVYAETEAATVDKLVTLTHGKGEKAGRDKWNAIARARHNRDVNDANEPVLDLFEKYLKEGKNITADQSERWAGKYPLSVLVEAVSKMLPMLGIKNANELAKQYPRIPHRDPVENILKDIGLETLTFPMIRGTVNLADRYGLPSLPPVGASSSGSSSTPASPAPTVTSVRKSRAISSNDKRVVRAILKHFFPLGKKREKVVALRDEAIQLDLDKTPFAFCFVLRSMFEISAKAYCDDHKKIPTAPKNVNAKGDDRKLKDILTDVYNHIVKSNPTMEKTLLKALHGAMTELGKPHGILSVTSMNQLIHNPSFSIKSGDISSTFVSVFPMLEAMNS